MDRLTKKEKEVFELMLKGLKRKEIAERLNNSIDTITSHARSIYAKFSVNSHVELLVKVRASVES